jgi:hypothetical protein
VQRATQEDLASQPDLGAELFAALAETAADALLAIWPQIEPREGSARICEPTPPPSSTLPTPTLIDGLLAQTGLSLELEPP